MRNSTVCLCYEAAFFPLLHCIKPHERILSSFLSHQAAISFGFSAWICNATTTEGSYRPQMIRIWNWDAHWVRAFWDTGPRYPRGVPWDQFFGLKIFILSWKYDVILCIFAIYYAKIRVYLVVRVSLMLIESGKKSSNFNFVIILDYFMPLLQEAHMDLTWLEFGVCPILTSGPTEIEALGTLGMSHGTKLLAPKNFSYHAQLMLFYVFLWFVLQKMLKSRLIWIFCFSLNKRMT